MAISDYILKLKKLLEEKENKINFSSEFKKLIENERLTYKDLAVGEKFNPIQKQKDNLEAIETLRKIESGEIKEITPKIKEKLLKFTGAGGTEVGSQDEYYTPVYVAENTWKFLGDIKEGDKILDPSAGTGVFARTAPKGVDLTQIEINETSAKINKIVTENKIINAPFEVASKDIEDNSLDGVITNVPFANRDKSLDTDPYFSDVTRLEDYFIIKSLQKLKYGKRAVFIMPTSFIDGKQKERIKKKILNYGSFLGALRLPNKVFSHTGADVAVDIVVFEKHPKEVIEAIKQGLVINESLKKVIYENKINYQFLRGNYFDKHPQNVIGIMVKNDEFVASRFFNGNNYGTKVLTPLKINEIKKILNEKANRLNFKNTTDYNKLQISGGYSIYSDSALNIINKSNEYVDYFEAFNGKDKVTEKDVKDFRAKFKDINSFDNRQILFSRKIFKGNTLYMAMATKANKDDKTALKFFNAFVLLESLIRKGRLDENDKKKIIKFNIEFLTIFKKTNTNKFLYNKSYCCHKEYNDIIKETLDNFRRFLSRWDFEKLDFIKTDIDEVKVTFDDLVFEKHIKIEKDEKGKFVDIEKINKKTILENPDLIPDGDKLYSFSSYFPYGLTYEDALNKLKNIKKPKKLTDKEFEDKINKIKSKLESLVTKPSIEKLVITIDNVDYVVPKHVINLVNAWGNKRIKEYFNKYPFLPKKPYDDFRQLSGSVYSISMFRSSFVEDILKLKSRDKETFDKIVKILKEKGFTKFVNLIEDDRPFISYIKDSAELTDNMFYYVAPLINEYKSKIKEKFNIELDTYCKQNETIRKAIEDNLNKQAKIGIKNEFISSLPIQSLKRFMSDEWVDKLHGYQNEDINKFSETLSGVVASQTGLGKSAISFGVAIKALVSGNAKRVLFVVPNGVFDKWKMEVKEGRYDDEGNQLVAPLIKKEYSGMVHFLDKKNSNVDYQNFIKDKNKRILFVTYSQFTSFDFKDDTIKKLMGDTKKEIESKYGEDINESLIPEFNTNDWAMLKKKSKNFIGYFEDGNFDLAIYDEAQYIKNSVSGGGNYKFASALPSSIAGLKSRALSAYLQYFKHNGVGKGTILVTATPFTNTPYEIFTTLKKIGKLENIKDLKGFENLFMNITEDYVPMATDPDKEIKVKKFAGLKNLDLLKNNGLEYISYRTAENEAQRSVNDIGRTNIKPDENANDIEVPQNPVIEKVRKILIEEYEIAKKCIKNDFKDISCKDFKNEDEVRKLASPFSLLSKIDKLAISPYMALNVIRFNVVGMDNEKIKKIIKELEKKKVTLKEKQQVTVKGELIEKDVTVKKTIKELAEEKGIELFKDGYITVPVTDYNIVKWVSNQLKNENGVFDLDDYPKYTELLKNIKKELDENKNAKQIIFSISLTGALIIEHLIRDFFKDLGIKDYLLLSTLKIDETLTDGEDKTDALMKFQEKYNNSSKPTILIFTRRTSTGVDFNRMTQAVHLMDIPYTPDVEEQAKGRAIRQGNPLSKVNVYKYKQRGSFDEAKDEILKNKNEWQNELLNNLQSEINEIDNLGIDKDVIALAIARFGANFTKEQLKTIIDEMKNKQAEILKQKREFKRQYYINEIHNTIKTISELNYCGLKEAVLSKIREFYPYNETRNSYKYEDPKQYLRTYKNIIKNLKKAVANYLCDFIQSKKIEISEVNQVIDEFIEEFKQNKFYWNEYFGKAVYVIVYSDKSPLTEAQKAEFEKLLKNTLSEIVDEINEIVSQFKNAKQNLKTLLIGLKEVKTDEDKELIENIEGILNGTKTYVNQRSWSSDVGGIVDIENTYMKPIESNYGIQYKDKVLLINYSYESYNFVISITDKEKVLHTIKMLNMNYKYDVDFVKIRNGEYDINNLEFKTDEAKRYYLEYLKEKGLK